MFGTAFRFLMIGMLASLGLATISGFAQQLTCADFTSAAAAQTVLNADPSDPFNLDSDDNGIACDEAESTDGVTPNPSATPAAEIPPTALEATMIEAIDGRTLRVDIDGTEIIVRLISVDAPNLDECLGEDAKNRIERLARPGATIFIETDVTSQDADGNTLGYVWVERGSGPVLLNDKLIEDGFAAFIEDVANKAHVGELLLAQQEAQTDNKRIWDVCDGPHSEIPPTPTPDVGQGTRESPYAIGATVTVGDYEVTVIDVVPDALDLVMAENQFNDPPAPGNQFFLVTVGLKYLGTETANPFDLSFNAVGASNVGYDGFSEASSCGVVPNDIFTLPELFPGGEAQVNACWQISSADADSLVMYIEPSFSFDGGDRVFFAIRES